jgi:hypothetical protein
MALYSLALFVAVGHNGPLTVDSRDVGATQSDITVTNLQHFFIFYFNVNLRL